MAKGLLFSGQGAQFVGMGQSLCEHSEEVQSLYDSAEAILGWDLKAISFEGPDRRLRRLKVCQPAFYVHGYSLYKLLEEKGFVDE